jgi:hypothetical protein
MPTHWTATAYTTDYAVKPPRVDDGQTGSQRLLQGHYTKCPARGRDERNGEIAPRIGIVSGYLSPGFAETIYKLAKTGTNVLLLS